MNIWEPLHQVYNKKKISGQIFHHPRLGYSPSLKFILTTVKFGGLTFVLSQVLGALFEMKHNNYQYLTHEPHDDIIEYFQPEIVIVGSSKWIFPWVIAFAKFFNPKPF